MLGTAFSQIKREKRKKSMFTCVYQRPFESLNPDRIDYRLPIHRATAAINRPYRVSIVRLRKPYLLSSVGGW